MLKSRRLRRLWDAYRFPGFRPDPVVVGIFGDPLARIVLLHRRAKNMLWRMRPVASNLLRPQGSPVPRSVLRRHTHLPVLELRRVACRSCGKQLWDYRTERGARRFLDNWRDALKWQRLKPYETFAAMIERHWSGVAAYCRPENKVALGFVEGLNTKIRVLQRRAFGLRDQEYLRLKVLTCMLPPL